LSRAYAPEDGAVLHVEHEADGLPAVAEDYEFAEDLDVVIFGVKDAFVESLLERHHHRRHGARNRASQARAPLRVGTTAVDRRLTRRSATR
jgi:hypothetical protein